MDASLFQARRKLGHGAVILIRDSDGRFVAARSTVRYCSYLIPAVAEALNIREALSWLKQLGVGPVYIETDALLVNTAISKGTKDGSCFGMIKADCICLFKDIPNCKVSFIRSQRIKKLIR